MSTLTYLIPTLIGALTNVSREGLGFIEAVDQDFSDQGAALNQSINVGEVDGVTISAVTPATTGPTPTASVPTNIVHAIRSSRSAKFGLTAEEERSIRAMGPAFRSNKIEQAFRYLSNEIEVDIAELFAGASRAYGTATTAPFASTLQDAFNLEKMLFDNGAIGENHLVLNSNAWLKLGSLTPLTNVDQAGTDVTLRQARFPQIASFNLHRSAQVQRPAVGTGAGYLCDSPAAATYAIGTTEIHIDTGTGTVLAGDVVTFTGDTNKYVVAVGCPGDSDQDIVLAAPGLIATLANNVAMTIVAISTRNMAFTRQSIILSTRAPLMPEGGDSASDVQLVTDPFSGLTFQVAEYRQYRQVTYEVGIAWGATARKAADIMNLLGE